MSAQYLNSWNPVAKTAANTAMLSFLSGGYIAIYDESDVFLGSVLLDNPVGVVNSETGALTLSASTGGLWVASSFASYASLHLSTDDVVQSLECIAGAVAIEGKCVLTTLTTVVDKPFSLLSWVLP